MLANHPPVLFFSCLTQLTLNLQTDLNFIGSPVKYSCGVTTFAKMSKRNAPEHGACTRKATMFPMTDCNALQETKNAVIWGLSIDRAPPQTKRTHLHDESLERHRVEGVLFAVVELEVVVENEAALHVRGHRYSHSGCPCGQKDE